MPWREEAVPWGAGHRVTRKGTEKCSLVCAPVLYPRVREAIERTVRSLGAAASTYSCRMSGKGEAGMDGMDTVIPLSRWTESPPPPS